MSRVLFVEPIGGVAGDMLLAALLDAGAPADVVRAAVEAVLPGRFDWRAEEVARAGMRAAFLRISNGPAAGPDGPAGPEGPDGTAGPDGLEVADRLRPRPFRDLRAAVERASLPEGTRTRALAVLDHLGRAESRVHGVSGADLALHQLGDDDTLLDVVGISAALDALGADEVLVSAIPLGMGDAESGPQVPHGPSRLPAPATLELLRGFELRPAGAGETVTPTGAAVLAALGRPAARFPAMTLEAVGYGAGRRDPPDRPNVVRVSLGAPAESDLALAGSVVRDLLVLEANLDDLSPELVADAVAALFDAGALDAWTTPIQMKKGRLAVALAALCEPAVQDRVRRAFFESTTTFGVRSTRVRRAELDRRTATVEVAGGTVRVKLGLLGGRVVNATPEHDDVASNAAATGRPVREVYEEAAAAARAFRLEATASSPSLVAHPVSDRHHSSP